jgi:molybdenum cofactor guanylyltransferase
VLGAVLCGGRSSRMGTDKASLVVGGVAMARRVADALAAGGCSPVIAVGGSPSLAASLGLAHLPDAFPGHGPLGGIITAATQETPVVVAACDLPGLTPTTVSALIAALDRHHAAVARTARPEPLCAAWSRFAIDQLDVRFGQGERAVYRCLDGLDVGWVAVADDELRNVNTPDDLESL